MRMTYLGLSSASLSSRIDNGHAHALGVVDVFAEDNGLLVGVGGVQQLHHPFRHQLGALVEHQDAVHVGLVVFALFDFLPEVILHARRRSPPIHIPVDVDAHDLVRREKTILDALFQAVGINRLSEVAAVGNVLGFLGRGRQTHLHRTGKVIKDFAPRRIVGSAAAMAFVDDDQVEEIARDGFENLVFFGRAGESLIQAEMNFVGRVDFAVLDLGHDRAERLEVIDQRLIDKDVAIGKEQYAPDRARLPQPPDDHGDAGAGLARAGGHDQQHRRLPLGDRFNHAVDGFDLIVAGLFAAAVVKVRLDTRASSACPRCPGNACSVSTAPRARERLPAGTGFRCLRRPTGGLVV